MFDAWRIELYLVSVGEDEYNVESELSNLADGGKLLRCPNQLFRLAELPQCVTFEYGVEALRPDVDPRQKT